MPEHVLPDSSVWVDYLRGSSPSLRELASSQQGFAYTEPILMELLAGARNDSETVLIRNLVISGRLLRFDALADFEGAAAIHRIGKERGLTVGVVDCMILSVTRRLDASLLTRDRKQAALAAIVGARVTLAA